MASRRIGVSDRLRSEPGAGSLVTWDLNPSTGEDISLLRGPSNPLKVLSTTQADIGLLSFLG